MLLLLKFSDVVDRSLKDGSLIPAHLTVHREQNNYYTEYDLQKYINKHIFFVYILV